MRGEYIAAHPNCISPIGSPPLARGIPFVLRQLKIVVRITPACAGNTVPCLDNLIVIGDHPRLRGEYVIKCHSVSCVKGDHPRLRGEYELLTSLTEPPLGSPPLARGILLLTNTDYWVVRITPACAGNTDADTSTDDQHRDHPRLRGEYFKVLKYSP